MRETAISAQSIHGGLAIGYGAAIAPDNGGADHILVHVNAHESMHLIGDADG